MYLENNTDTSGVNTVISIWYGVDTYIQCYVIYTMFPVCHCVCIQQKLYLWNKTMYFIFVSGGPLVKAFSEIRQLTRFSPKAAMPGCIILNTGRFLFLFFSYFFFSHAGIPYMNKDNVNRYIVAFDIDHPYVHRPDTIINFIKNFCREYLRGFEQLLQSHDINTFTTSTRVLCFLLVYFTYSI